MLNRLLIENYVLIDQLDAEFGVGLNTITGETGAGKSILLGAMGLLMGAKADVSVLKRGAKSCVVEMQFTLSDEFKPLFEELELDFDPQTVLRRTISGEGRSRAYVNDAPVTLTVLKSVSTRLLDIHSQHQNLLLGDAAFQTDLLDRMADNGELLERCATQYATWGVLVRERQRLSDEAAAAARDRDYIEFQYTQLAEAKLSDDELTQLEEESNTLTHAAEIKEVLYGCDQIFSDEERSVIEGVKSIGQQLERLMRLYPAVESLAVRVDSALIELKDISSEVTMLSERIADDPQRLEAVNARLDLIYSLLQKHRKETVPELIELTESYRQKLSALDNSDQTLDELQHQIDAAQERLNEVCAEISQRRVAQVPAVKHFIESELSKLGMPNARFEVEFSQTEPSSRGADGVRFLFTANRNSDLQAIEKIVSGGEMSRLMLVIKALVARHRQMPTVIFDEIDQGISGEVAHKMGAIIEALSHDMQVLNITHLPQIAAKGDTHFKVYKRDSAEATQTYITRLTATERIEEIARMLSGENVTEAARTQAANLLNLSE